MATEEEEVTDILWEKMKTLAMEQQQCYYELLPDCIMYKNNEYKYLKQNIGYALFGSPMGIKDSSATESSGCYYKTENLNDTDAADTVDYEEKDKKVINNIYDKMCEYEIEIDGSKAIYFGVIYNIIFRPKMNVMPKEKEEKKKETEVKMEAKTEIKTEAKMKVKTEAKTKVEMEAKKETKEDEKELLIVSPIPIFTIIKKSVQKKSNKTANSEKQGNTTDEIQYETLYIDTSARVYKNWTDYTENNKLPKCTMVLPKDGTYQANFDYPRTEEYSTVWLEIMESPACTWKAKLCNGMDIASNVVGFGAVGLGVASLLTPLAPAVIVSSLVVSGVSGIWSLGRNSQQLADRISHEESIHVLNKEALPHYLGIAGTTFGLGAMGGSVVISKLVARGMTVNTFARVAFNTVQGGNLIINGFGILYQGYNIYDKYKTEREFSYIDALNFATHLMFFCGSVVKVQFANDIIESTQGRIMEEYKENLSTKRLRKNFNRQVRRAAENNTCKMSKNAEVIRYIRNRQELLSNQSVTSNGGNQISDNTSRNVVWSCEHGILKVNGILLLDPIEYVIRLIKLGIFIEVEKKSSSSRSQNYTNDSIDQFYDQLTKVLCDLLSKLCVSDDCPKSTKIPLMPDFEPLLREMRSMNINEDYLKKLFNIAVKLMKRSKNMDDFLLQSFMFVWQYCKANLKKWGMSLCYTQSVSSSKILKKIIFAVCEAIDMILDNLADAFMRYMYSSLHR